MQRDAWDQSPYQARFVGRLEVENDQGFHIHFHASYVNSTSQTINFCMGYYLLVEMVLYV